MHSSSVANCNPTSEVHWKCKLCSFTAEIRAQLLNHYRWYHSFRSSFVAWPCLYTDCICSLKSVCSLRTHLSRCHDSKPGLDISSWSIRCPICSSCRIADTKQLIAHLCHHCVTHETVACPLKECSYMSCIKSTFRSHVSRYHPYPIPVSLLKSSCTTFEAWLAEISADLRETVAH